jgi:thioredoxin-related protein
MNQRNLAVGLLVFVILAFGGLVFYDIKYGHKFEKRFGTTKEPAQNWKWEDDWNSKGAPVGPQTGPTTPGPVVPAPEAQQLIAGNYAEALQRSAALGKPILAFFTADWCNWCQKMKTETMSDARVKTVLKNYILVYVDADKDRDTTKKFGVTTLPSYVVTNANETKLKMDTGFKNADSFASWLNDSKLFDQPKKSPDQPRPQPQPQQRPQIRPQPQPRC